MPRRAAAAAVTALLLSLVAPAFAAGPWSPVGPPGGAACSLAVDPKAPSTLYGGAGRPRV